MPHVKISISTRICTHLGEFSGKMELVNGLRAHSEVPKEPKKERSGSAFFMKTCFVSTTKQYCWVSWSHLGSNSESLTYLQT